MPQPSDSFRRVLNQAHPKPSRPQPSEIEQRTGMSLDDPALPFMARCLFRARREGKDIRDPAILAHCAGMARFALALHADEQQEIAQREQTCWVYYLQVADYIKIGATFVLRSRLSAYPPFTKVLAVEHGYTRREAQRLAEFAEYLAGGNEWFHPGERLMAHIRTLHDAAQLAALVAPRWVGEVKPQP